LRERGVAIVLAGVKRKRSLNAGNGGILAWGDQENVITRMGRRAGGGREGGGTTGEEGKVRPGTLPGDDTRKEKN